MARHIMAVCVVCLLCADRLPCEQHYDDNDVIVNSVVYPTTNVEYKQLNAKVFQRLDTPKDVVTPQSQPQSQQQNNNAELKFDYTTDNSPQNNHQQQQQYTSKHQQQPNIQKQQQRRKRHAGHAHGGEEATAPIRPAITQDFLQRIFDEYGNGDGSLSINEFRTMLKKLGLHQLVEQSLATSNNAKKEQHNNSSSSRSSSSRPGAGSCLADANLIQHLKEQISKHHHDNEHEHQQHHHHHHHNLEFDDGDETSSHKLESSNNNKNNNEAAPTPINCTQIAAKVGETFINISPCVSSAPTPLETELSLENSYLKNYTIDDMDLINLCPILLYHMASPLESEREGCIDQAILVEIEERQRKNVQTNKEDMVYVWTYAFISVFACGILGLVGVAIIPFMDSRYYKHIIQYLVSLAVGTMTGDALLHLLPHSLAGQSESGMIFKGLTCMGGIIFFYLTEHGLTMISEWRKRKAKKDTKQSRAKVLRDPDSSITAAGDKLCKSKYSSYPYCYDEIAMDTKNDVWMHLPNNTAVTTTTDKMSANAVGAANKRNGRAEANANEVTAAQSLLSTSHNNYAPMTEMTTNHHHHPHHHHHHLHHNHQHDDHQHSELEQNSLHGDGSGGGGTVAGNGANANNTNVVSNITKDTSMPSDTVTVILREHESSHHGHSHKHGHVHSPPESLSAVAWMIIMGDGLHNFTDGMAIGAAFAENIAGGFSTSLAVFCHELPHELGDFAILMKAGMSVKSAVYYNLLTGVLSFIGMIFGIVFGQSQDAAQWMFAAAAGLFIYIALVDMMPELSASHKSLEQLALQIFGMSTGVFLMLLIAIYENDLMDVFSSSSSSLSSSSTSSSSSKTGIMSSPSSTLSFGPASGH